MDNKIPINEEYAEAIFNKATQNIANNFWLYIPFALIIYFIIFKLFKWNLISKILIIICFFIPFLLILNAFPVVLKTILELVNKNQNSKYLYYANLIMIFEALLYIFAILFFIPRIFSI